MQCENMQLKGCTEAEVFPVMGPQDRKLAVSLTGDLEGFPVFLMHGTPGSRVGIKPDPSVARHMGVCLVSYDRPGYGLSDRHEWRSVADCAEDVRSIADHIGFERFAVMGRSGGGPHALACAAKLGERVTKAAVLVCPAPKKIGHAVWYANMARSNVAAFSAEIDVVMADILGRAERAKADPEAILNELDSELMPVDRDVIRHTVGRRHIIESFEEGLRNGPYGWVDDVLALRQPWGFALSSIQTPVTLWHGAKDPFYSVDHAYRLVYALGKGVRFTVDSRASHFNAVEMIRPVLGDLWRSAHSRQDTTY